MQHIRYFMLAASIIMLTCNTVSTFAMTEINTALQSRTQKPEKQKRFSLITNITCKLQAAHEKTYANKEDQAKELINALQDLIQFEIQESSESFVASALKAFGCSAASIFFFYTSFIFPDNTNCQEPNDRIIIAQAIPMIVIPISGLYLYYSYQTTKMLKKIDAALTEHNNQDLMDIADIFHIPTVFFDRIIDIIRTYELETNIDFRTIKQPIQHDEINITEYIRKYIKGFY